MAWRSRGSPKTPSAAVLCQSAAGGVFTYSFEY